MGNGNSPCLLASQQVDYDKPSLGFSKKIFVGLLEGMTGVASGLCACMFQPLE